MAESQLIKTIESYVSHDNMKNLDSFKKLKTDVEYLENYISHDGVPRILGMISNLLTEHMQDSALYTSPSQFTTYGFASHPRTEDGFIEIDQGLHGLGIKQNVNDETGFTFHINRFGYNMSGGLKRSARGVHIRGYQVPASALGEVLDEFTKVEGERNDVLLELARLEDLIESTENNSRVTFQQAYIEKGDVPSPGIDQHTAYTFEKDLGSALVFGTINGYVHTDELLSLDLRIEKKGERFQFPSQRQPGHDITEPLNQGKQRDLPLHYYNEFPEESEHGKEFISYSLVGKDAVYVEHSTPKDLIRPLSPEVSYDDAYLTVLNEQYPLDSIFDEETLKEMRETQLVRGYASNSPMQNSESETIMEGLLYRSAVAGKWQPTIIEVAANMSHGYETAGEFIDSFESARSTYGNNARVGFAIPTPINQTKVAVLPSQKFVEYIADKHQQLNAHQTIEV